MKKVYIRQVKKGQYNYVTTLPHGACNVSIETGDIGNYLALRWESNKKFFLNGDWIIDEGGNYTIKKTSFVYETRDMTSTNESSDKFFNRVSFKSTLSGELEVYLLAQRPNTGLEYSFFLPPKATTAATSVPSNASKAFQTNAQMDQDQAEDDDSVSAGSKSSRQNGVYQNFPGLAYPRLDASPLASSAPWWIADFNNVMKLWLKRLEKAEKEISWLKSRKIDGER